MVQTALEYFGIRQVDTRKRSSVTIPHSDPNFSQERYDKLFDRVNDAAKDTALQVPGTKIPVTEGDTTVMVVPQMTWGEIDKLALELYYNGKIPPETSE